MRIRILSGRILIAAILSLVRAAAQEKPFTLEQVMSSPFPKDLVAAPTKGKVAWVFNAQGTRNIWVAEPSAPGGNYKARKITAYTEDDGQDLGELCWTPEAEAIVYTRGGDLEMLREYPNPRSFPQGVEQDVWVISLAEGQPRRLAEGRSPAVSPAGDRVAYIYKDQVWSAKIDASEKPAQLIHTLGKSASLRWSPDATKLAFVSSRGDHSFIGVYDFTSATLRYLDPSVDRDAEPAWSPDGKQIAFIRIPASREASAFGPKPSGQPWSIRVADIASSAGRQVWIAREGRGSVFRAVQAGNQLMWGVDDRLVFPWEGDGWTHLYSIPAQGRVIHGTYLYDGPPPAPDLSKLHLLLEPGSPEGFTVLMTPGNFEVEYASLTPDRKEVLFSSNQEDIDRRHIWRVPVAGRRPVVVTSGTGIEWSPVMTSDGKSTALLRSDARGPARPAILTGHDDVLDLATEAIPATFPEKDLVEPQPVIISAADGLKIHGQLFLPRHAGKNARHPAIVFFHGGSRRQMLLGWHYMEYYHSAYAMNQYLASQGYIVLSVNYRSGIGYGMEFREAPNYGATGASEFNDVLGAGLYLRSRPDVYPQRIGLWGGSYGGYLTALGLARASDLFAAGVDLHGVHDWNLEIPNFVPAYDPRANPDAARLAFESSPMAAVTTWRSPVLLIQGDDDRNVPFAEMVQLVEALRKQGVEFEQLVFPDEIHEFLIHARWLEAYHAAADFFGRHIAR